MKRSLTIIKWTDDESKQNVLDLNFKDYFTIFEMFSKEKANPNNFF